MSPGLSAVFEQVRHYAALLHGAQHGFQPLFDRAWSEDPDRASSAIVQLAREHDPALAAIAWSFFWVRQSELSQARNELESIADSTKPPTFWSGMAALTLGEICLELGDTQKGIAQLRRARQILGEPQ